MKFAVIVFPGSNCDLDMYSAVSDLGGQVDYVWHTNSDLSDYDCILLPGGFSYGDYLRCGAIARFSPVIQAVIEAAGAGKLVLGVCNGFQILLEAGLLPGAIYRNTSLRFRCLHSNLKVENNETAFTNGYQAQEIIRIPIAHGDGNYICDDKTLRSLEENNQIVFRYQENPNGSLANIAGICNERGNVLGMMPHPERAVDALLGSVDGRPMFTSMLAFGRRENVAS